MFRLLLRYGPAILMAVGPLLTNSSYSLLDEIGLVPVDGRITVSAFSYSLFDGPKGEVEMQMRTAVTLFGVALLIVSGYFDAFLPSRTLESFRHDYLQEVCSSQWRHKNRIRKDVRINVMYLRFRWYWPFSRRFRVVWRDGFDPADTDGDMWLCIWQGLCGSAARKRNAQFVDFRTNAEPIDTFYKKWLLGNKFRLFRSQLKKTSELKAILSVPIFETRGEKGREKKKCVGVINLDTKTDAGADHLNQQSNALAAFLAKHGTLIAKMR